jgi:hypothetical protein
LTAAGGIRPDVYVGSVSNRHDFVFSHARRFRRRAWEKTKEQT